MDLRKTTVPKSDQLNADDLIAGPVTVTIERVEEGSTEQPVNIYLSEYPGRSYRPSKSMQRVLLQVWGWDTDAFHGRRMTLFRNEKITFGRDEVGGIQISHLSHIDKPMYPAITPKRGQKKPFPVKPLAEPVTEPWVAQWQAIRNALTEAGYEGDGPALLVTAGQVIGSTWEHPNKISAEDAQAILAAVREDNQKEN